MKRYFLTTISFIVVYFSLSFPSYSWFMTDVESGRRFYCPPKMIPIISEFNTHFTIPLGGPKGAEVVFDYITTDFSVQGRYNGGRKKYRMHCAEFVKRDCHRCNPTKEHHENYCSHYIHPTKGRQQGCLARGIIPQK